jgi:shikimate kinase/3-dehydroquinate synthase
MKTKNKNIILVGMAGVGKSTLGKLLARLTGYRFVDSDFEIEKEEASTISVIFKEKGEPYFRALEKKTIQRLTQIEKPSVIATGGGTLLNQENRENLKKSGILVCLTASAEEILKRIRKEEKRPLLKGGNLLMSIRTLQNEREAIYKGVDLIVETDHKTPLKIAREILNRIKSEPSRQRAALEVSLKEGRSYPIILGNGNLIQLGEYLAPRFQNKIAVVTNPRIWRLHGALMKRTLVAAGFKPLVLQIPDGEQYKNMKWVNYIIGELLKNRYERSSPVLAFGGGVIGDLAGFVSGIYLRGTPFIQVPTTMIAQVDSSIGGKTGVNDPMGKNMIGVFHQPEFVWIDIALLKTLSKRDYLSGLGEVVKYGMIADSRFFEYLETKRIEILSQSAEELFHAIFRSCQIKGEVVSQDEKESGIRKILNYGHTMGHAVESATAYKRYRHGEAIGIGMHFAARLSVRIEECTSDLMQRQKSLLESYSLPVNLPKVNAKDLIKIMELDKKVKEGKIYFILPSEVGKVVIKPVDKHLILEVTKKGIPGSKGS